MYGMGSISDGSQISSSALAVCLFRIVLYGYSPVPKYCILIPERTSNSVFAVPAPTTGTVR